MLITLMVGTITAGTWYINSLLPFPSTVRAAEAMPESPPLTTNVLPAVNVAGISGITTEPADAQSLPTVPPWPTMQHVPTVVSTPPAAAVAVEPPQQVMVNGVPWERIINLSPDVIAHAKSIYAAGQLLGRNPHAYSKVGDSTSENPHFLTRFDEGPYDLGPYAYLEPAVAHFRGSHSRDSIAVRIGLHAWTANDPMWAESNLCLPNETPVQCEIRINNPVILLIRLGSNDSGAGSSFDANIRQIVEAAIAAGVIPVIGTKGDRHEGSNENNDILLHIAADYQIPLWDYDLVADTMPNRGLDIDNIHMLSYYAHDYTDPTANLRGHAMHNLTALMMLDALWRLVVETEAVAP